MHLKHTKSLNDQDVLNMYKPQRYGLLDKNLFTNGFRFYENRHKHPVSRNLILVHHNWISGDSNKWNRAKNFDCILNESTKNSFSKMLWRSSQKSHWVFKKKIMNQNC